MVQLWACVTVFVFSPKKKEKSSLKHLRTIMVMCVCLIHLLRLVKRTFM